MSRSARSVPTPATLGHAFRTEWIDPKKGIRVGNLEPYERITQIIKFYLQDTYGQPFVIDKWGRGSYWRWICWVPKLNRQGKPISSDGSWSSAKFFISMFPEEEHCCCGLQVERGPAVGPARFPGCLLQDDWDWHHLVGQLRKGSKLDDEMRRLIVQDGFEAWIGEVAYTAEDYTSAGQLKRALRKVKDNEWAGFQLYYPFPCAEVKHMTGPEFIEAACAVFDELTDAMNCVVDVPIARQDDSASRPAANPGSSTSTCPGPGRSAGTP